MAKEGANKSQEGMRTCPACRTPIPIAATRCRHCGCNVEHYLGGFQKITQEQLAVGQSQQIPGRDLSKAAASGELEPAYGRDTETEQVSRLIFESRGRSILVVGGSGSGKSQFVRGVALAAYRRSTRTGEPCTIIEFNFSCLQSKAVQIMDNVEHLLSLQRESPVLILFDAITPILDADPSERSAAGVLAKSLAEGTLHCLGTLNTSDFERLLRKKPALLPHFETVRLGPLSESVTLEILKRRRETLEKRYGISIADEALQAAITLTGRHIPRRELPGIAIDVLDLACRPYKNWIASKKNTHTAWLDDHTMKHLGTEVGVHDVKRVLAEELQVVIEDIEAQEVWRKRLEERLKQVVVGQDAAIEQFAEAATRMRLHFSESRLLSGFTLFGGPRGTGKVLLARMFAKQLLGSIEDLAVFDMGQYSREDAAARLFGCDTEVNGDFEMGDLTGAVRDRSRAVIVFDGIERAHSSVLDILLLILSTGSLKDRYGHDLSLRKCVLIMTLNCPAPPLSESHTPSSLRALLASAMRPEVVDQIQAFVPFRALNSEDARAIIRRLLERFCRELKPLEIRLRIREMAYEHLIQHGVYPEFGVEKLPEILYELVIQPVRALVKSKRLTASSVLEVRAASGKISVHLLTQQDAQ